MKSSIKIVVLVLVVFLTSCVKDLDFDQANTLELTPSYVVSLVNFQIPQTTIVDNNGNEISVSDRSEITVLNSQEAKDYLEKLILKVEVANTFNRDFTLTFNFFDTNGLATYKPIKMNVSAQDLAFTFEEEIIVTNNPNFLNTRQIEATIELHSSTDGTIIDRRLKNTFTLKSAATLFFRVNKN